MSSSEAGGIRQEPQVRRLATWTFLHSFGKGFATIFLETAASALFLVTFAADWLPYVYIGAAILTTLAGLLYARLEQKTSFDRLILGTLACLFLLVVAAQIAIVFSPGRAVVFALLVIYRLLWFTLDLEYWAVATRLFDVRQGKRLFSLMGSGEVGARILGALSVPLLVPWLGVERLVGLSAIGLAFSLVVVALTFREASPERVAATPQRGSEPPSTRRRLRRDDSVLLRILGDRYLGLISLLVVFGVLGKYFVDYAFLQEMQNRYDDAEALAGVFGIFAGGTMLLNLLVRVSISGRLLRRFGIGAGLLVLPVSHALCTLGIVAVGLVRAEDATAIFWLALANQALYKILKHPIDSPAFKVLYQPLRADRRLAAQIGVDMIINPLTTATAGLIMIIAIPYQPIQFAGIMLATFALWIGAVVPTWREYSRALLRALRRRSLGGGETITADRESLRQMEERLQSGHPGDVTFAVAFLERTDYGRMDRVLVDLLRRPSPQIRRFALDRIHEIALEAAVPELRSLADRPDEDLEIHGAVLRALGRLENEDALAERLGSLLGKPMPGPVQRGLVVGLLGRPPGPAQRRGLEELGRLIDSSSPVERVIGARILAESGDPARTPEILRLLSDPDLEVRRAALAAAGQAWSPELWGTVAKGLASPQLCSAATGTLVAAGSPILSELARDLARGDLPRSLRLRLARIAGRIRGGAAIDVLRAQINEPDPRLRLQILLSLSACGYRARSVQPQEIRDVLHEEAEAARWRLVDAATLPPSSCTGVELVRSALTYEAHLAHERMLLLLSFLLDPGSLASARENIRHTDPERRAYALEILEIALPRELRFVLGSFEKRIEAEPHRDGGAQVIRKLLEGSQVSLTAWTRACLARSAADLGLEGVEGTLEGMATAGPGVVTESARAALGRLADEPIGDPTMSMTTLEKVMILKSVSIFADTAEEILAEATQALEEVEVDAGESVFVQGDHGDSMYIVVHGKVRCHIGDRCLVDLGEREIFGELAVLDPEPRSASVTALEDTRLFRLDRDAFFELVGDHVEIAAGVFKVICTRLRRATA